MIDKCIDRIKVDSRGSTVIVNSKEQQGQEGGGIKVHRGLRKEPRRHLRNDVDATCFNRSSEGGLSGSAAGITHVSGPRDTNYKMSNDSPTERISHIGENRTNICAYQCEKTPTCLPAVMIYQRTDESPVENMRLRYTYELYAYRNYWSPCPLESGEGGTRVLRNPHKDRCHYLSSKLAIVRYEREGRIPGTIDEELATCSV